MRQGLIIVAVLLFCFPWSGPSMGDVLRLNDGTRLEGTLKREPGGWLVTDSSGKTTRVTDDRVAEIEKGSSLSPAESAQRQLEALRRWAEPLSDIPQIIGRYNRFIEQQKNTPAAAEARKDLEIWKSRKEQGLVKVGGEWVTPQQQAALLEKTASVIQQIRDMIQQGRFRDADEAVTRLLSANPNDASALYLRGILSYKQDQPGAARKPFERVREIMPDHGPTLNNLGVIYAQQKQWGPAMAMLDLAMQASPNNRTILDNAAELLAMLPQDQRGSAVAKRLSTRFSEQDAVLARQLASEGLTRWGATWLDSTQMQEVKKNEERIKARLELLAQDYDKLAARRRDVERQIDINDRSLDRINRDRSIVDPTTGNIVQLRPPSIYYELRRENERLVSEHRDINARMQEFPARERQIRQESPFPLYTGQLKLIGPEGTPLLGAWGAPATRPATRPVQAST